MVFQAPGPTLYAPMLVRIGGRRHESIRFSPPQGSSFVPRRARQVIKMEIVWYLVFDSNFLRKTRVREAANRTLGQLSSLSLSLSLFLSPSLSLSIYLSLSLIFATAIPFKILRRMWLFNVVHAIFTVKQTLF